MIRSLFALALAASLACGGHGPSPQPSPPDTGGGNPGNPGGGSPGGGNPGGNPGGSDPGGGGGAGGGGGTTEPSDPSVTIRRVDDSPECDGLLPSRAAPAVVADVPDAPDGNCGAGLSEGGGHVAVVRHFGRGFEEFQIFSPDGKPEERLTVATGNPLCFFLTTCGPLFPQPDGFLGARTRGGTSSHDPLSIDVLSFGADGALGRTETATTRAMGIERWNLHEDPRGGVLLVAEGEVPPDMPGAGTCGGHAFRFRADGSQRSAAHLGCRFKGAGVSNAGETLLLELADGHPGADRSRIFLEWLDADGTRARDETAELDLGDFPIHLAPLLQGGLAANQDGVWNRRYPHLGAAREAAPDWLAAHPGWSFRFTRGNQGYALFPPPGQELADCAPGVEIRSVNGRLCGTVTFREEGGACRTGALDQGWDGTVVQQSARNACSYRWWPRLLAKE